jgi:hypothetical protein
MLPSGNRDQAVLKLVFPVLDRWITGDRKLALFSSTQEAALPLAKSRPSFIVLILTIIILTIIIKVKRDELQQSIPPLA